MYIKKLQLLNFQVIENFDAEFDGNVYLITGDNELGKSTLLKAIGALLTGQRDEVLRNGASKGFAKMVVGDDGEEYEVQLSFTEANPRGTLTIKQKSTGMQTNNVSMLQRLFGYQDFDAVEFSRWSESAEGRRKQIAVVKSLLAPEVRQRIEDIDTEVNGLKTERTGINRDVKTFAALLEAAQNKLPADAGRYKDEINLSELLEKQQINAQLIEKSKTVKSLLEQRTAQLEELPNKMTFAQNVRDTELDMAEKEFAAAKQRYEDRKRSAIEKCDATLKELESSKADLELRKGNAEKWLKDYEASREQLEDTAKMLADAKEHNERHKIVAEYADKKRQFEDVKAKAEQMDGKIAELCKERAELIAGAKLPIEGLTFTDDGLELHGVPFVPGKVSDSQAMEIAAKLVIACNPNVKVFRIARGESLGAKRLQAIAELARKNGYQGFIEQVQRGQNEMRVEEYTE